MSKLASILNVFKGHTVVSIVAVRANSFLLDPPGVWSHKVCIHVAPVREWSKPSEIHQYVMAVVIGLEPSQWSKKPDDHTWPAELIYEEVIGTDKIKATRTIKLSDDIYVLPHSAFKDGKMVVDESGEREVKRRITVLVHHDAEEAAEAADRIDGLNIVSLTD